MAVRRKTFFRERCLYEEPSHMSMPRNALEIADEFIRRSGNTKTNMQIQKMVYIAHGYMLGAYGRPLISENVEAWKWGPVIPSLYRRFKKYGSDLITSKPGRRPDFDAEEKVCWNMCGPSTASIAGTTCPR